MPFDAQPQHVWSMVVVWGCLGPPQAPRRPEPDPPRKKHARPERLGRNSCPGAHVAAISARNDDTSFFCAASARHAPSAPAQPPARAPRAAAGAPRAARPLRPTHRGWRAAPAACRPRAAGSPAAPAAWRAPRLSWQCPALSAGAGQHPQSWGGDHPPKPTPGTMMTPDMDGTRVSVMRFVPSQFRL